MLLRILAISASAALLAGAAQAQTTQAPAGAAASADAASSAPAAPVDTTGYNSQSSAATSGAVIPESSSALGDPNTLKAGDPGVVSNGPVPDTPANRAKFGRPDSTAGKRTAPAGN